MNVIGWTYKDTIDATLIKTKEARHKISIVLEGLSQLVDENKTIQKITIVMEATIHLYDKAEYLVRTTVCYSIL